MKDLINFNNDILGKLSVIEEDDGTLWFIGNQVTKMLGHEDLTRALRDIPHDWKKVIKYDKFKSDVLDKFVTANQAVTNSKTRKLTIITEGALYYLVSRGQTELSKYFNRWLFGEVVPTIRKQGMYIKEDLLRDNRDLYGDDDYCTEEEIERGYAHIHKSNRTRNLL